MIRPGWEVQIRVIWLAMGCRSMVKMKKEQWSAHVAQGDV